ncbi:MAG: serine esterase [Pedosphaera sp.]|nr:serine esterase [Pedosphaera sp.]
MLETEFIPATDKKTRRLMVMLHGLGDTMEGFRWLPEALRLPWMNYLLVNAPDPYYGGFSWYDFMGQMETGVRRSRNLLFELLDAQRAKGFPTSQTVVSGFSQGCLMTIEVGCRYPHKLAGLVGISGYVADPELVAREFSPVAKQQRFLITHGFHDPIVPFAVTREQINLLKRAGLNISWHEFVKAHNIAGEAELSVIRDFIIAGYGPV